MWTTLNSKKDVDDFANQILELLDQEVNIYFIPIGHTCNEEKLQQIKSMPNMQLIYIHQRIEHEVYCLFQAYKQYKAGFDFYAYFEENSDNSEDEGDCYSICWFCFPQSQDSQDNLSKVLQHMRCPCCFNQTKRIHTGEEPYQCEVCEKSFTSKNTLEKNHINAFIVIRF